MPEFFIRATKQATVEVQYLIKAEDAHEAMRQVYNGAEPMIVGQPSLSWDTKITENPREVV